MRAWSGTRAHPKICERTNSFLLSGSDHNMCVAHSLFECMLSLPEIGSGESLGNAHLCTLVDVAQEEETAGCRECTHRKHGSKLRHARIEGMRKMSVAQLYGAVVARERRSARAPAASACATRPAAIAGTCCDSLKVFLAAKPSKANEAFTLVKRMTRRSARHA